MVSSAEAIEIQDFLNGKDLNPGLRENLVNQGYLVDPAEEERLYKGKYLDFLDERDTDEIQIFFVPNYSCNFACSYCYQDEYLNSTEVMRHDIVNAFFDYVNKEFSGRKKYLTIFGGEPLLNSPRQREIIQYFLELAFRFRLEVSLVTNGYYLEDYIDILKASPIREIQVTLDGVGPVHDKRRFLKGGGPSFEKIVRGIDACLSNALPINLRVVLDKENIDALPELADFAIEKGWTQSKFFKTQLGRNYELHHCQVSAERLFSRVSMYESIYALTQQHPQILEFHKPAFSVAKFLSENGDLPDPLFDACPACKTEWAFDFSGHIFSCTATVGKPGESLGTFYPEITRKDDMIHAWENRDVTTIPECGSCNLRLACGGGCGAVAKNRNGEICSSDCRPVKELLELGFAAYFPEEKAKDNP
jgi:uncharacterized protein